jgi:hypothetical protein
MPSGKAKLSQQKSQSTALPKPKPQLPPPLKTRDRNKTNRPGQPVLDAMQKRRTAEEMAAAREEERVSAEENTRRRAESTAASAHIEDQLRQEDVERELTANKPPPSKYPPIPPNRRPMTRRGT